MKITGIALGFLMAGIAGFFVGRSWSDSEPQTHRPVDFEALRSFVEQPLVTGRPENGRPDPLLSKVDWWNEVRWWIADPRGATGTQPTRELLEDFTGYVFSDMKTVSDEDPVTNPVMTIHLINGEPIWMGSKEFRAGFIDGRPRYFVNWEVGHGESTVCCPNLIWEVDAQGNTLHTTMIHEHNGIEGRKRMESWFADDGRQLLSVESRADGNLSGLVLWDKDGKQIRVDVPEVIGETSQYQDSVED